MNSHLRILLALGLLATSIESKHSHSHIRNAMHTKNHESRENTLIEISDAQIIQIES